MYKAVIFDLDGTLLNTFEDLGNSVNFALEKMNFPLRTMQEVRRFIGNGVVVLMSRAVPEGTSEKDSKEALDIFRQHYLSNMNNNTKPYDGVLELLDILKQRGIKTAVVSNKLHEAVVELCELYFGDRLDLAYGVSNEDERKPKPNNVYKALEKLGVQGNDSIYIGDSEVDVQTAHNANIGCIGVTWGARDIEDLQESGVEFIANDITQVLERLNMK